MHLITVISAILLLTHLATAQIPTRYGSHRNYDTIPTITSKDTLPKFEGYYVDKSLGDRALIEKKAQRNQEMFEKFKHNRRNAQRQVKEALVLVRTRRMADSVGYLVVPMVSLHTSRGSFWVVV